MKCHGFYSRVLCTLKWWWFNWEPLFSEMVIYMRISVPWNGNCFQLRAKLYFEIVMLLMKGSIYVLWYDDGFLFKGSQLYVLWKFMISISRVCLRYIHTIKVYYDYISVRTYDSPALVASLRQFLISRIWKANFLKKLKKTN